jgi:hypothetical protein
MTQDERALFEAIEEGNKTAIINLLDIGVNVNARDTDFGGESNCIPTPLITAILLYKPPIVKILLERGANVEALFAGCNSIGLICFLPLTEFLPFPFPVGMKLPQYTKGDKTRKLYEMAKLVLGAHVNVNHVNNLYEDIRPFRPLSLLLEVQKRLNNKELNELIELLKQHGAIE